MRNVSCSRAALAGGASPALETRSWLRAPRDDRCPRFGAAPPPAGWRAERGRVLPGGDDAAAPEPMPRGGVEAARARCEAIAGCVGFTFERGAATGEAAGGPCSVDAPCAAECAAGDAPCREACVRCDFHRAAEAPPPTVFYKNRQRAGALVDGWETHRRAADCGRRGAPAAVEVAADGGEPEALGDRVARAVRVLRREPLVALVDDFVDEAECAALRAHVDGRLKRARTGAKTAGDEGELDSYRRALSATIEVDPYDGDDAATRVSERVFALAREVAGLRAWLPGQEALSVIEYGANDEYRPHCDGNCAGGPYERGQRAATAIAFCETAARGGATAFTRGGLVITPRPRQLLLFAYKHANGSMDDGHTGHSGCPVDEGRKWIVTQWLREDVSLEQPWFSFDNW